MKFRWLVAIVAAIAVAAGLVAVPHGAAADLPLPRTPRPTVIEPSPAPSLAPIVVMSVGDSLTEGTDLATKGTIYGSYRPEMSRLMNLTGQAHTWVIQAQGGTKCSYWAARMGSLIDTYHPDLVLLNCGTNDTPSDSTEADYATILAAAAARHTLLIGSLIGRPYMGSTVNQTRPWIEGWMDATNDAIRRALANYPAVPYANMLRVPNTPEWLTDDGIHLTARAEAAWAWLFFLAAFTVMHWLTPAQMHVSEMCGLSGHDRDDPWPTPGVAYRVCWS